MNRYATLLSEYAKSAKELELKYLSRLEVDGLDNNLYNASTFVGTLRKGSKYDNMNAWELELIAEFLVRDRTVSDSNHE